MKLDNVSRQVHVEEFHDGRSWEPKSHEVGLKWQQSKVAGDEPTQLLGFRPYGKLVLLEAAGDLGIGSHDMKCFGSADGYNRDAQFIGFPRKRARTSDQTEPIAFWAGYRSATPK